MTIQEALEKLQGYEKATFALNHATGLMYYDGATIAPKGTTELRGSTLGELSRMGYELTTAPETMEMLRTLMENREELEPITRRKAEELWRDYDRTHRVPVAEYVAYQELSAKSDAVGTRPRRMTSPSSSPISSRCSTPAAAWPATGSRRRTPTRPCSPPLSVA